MATTPTEPIVVEGDPGGPGTLLRAALPALPVVNQLPGVRKDPAADPSRLAFVRPEVAIRREHVDRYAEVCGFPRKDVVPLSYPHMLAFGLHMEAMTDPDFPFAAVGSVHLENSITGHRPIAIGETVEVSVRVSPTRPHPKGTLVDFLSEVRAGGELVWESRSTYLRRGRGDADAPAGTSFEDVPPSGPLWRLPADLGRRYAAVSGDHNPIHLYPLTAKALGFKRQIAHGMWTKARCIAALENRLPDSVTVDVAFKKPVFLPGRVAFGSRPTTEGPEGYAFSLSDPRSGAPHLLGRATRA